jgi:hypothetical protein
MSDSDRIIAWGLDTPPSARTEKSSPKFSHPRTLDRDVWCRWDLVPSSLAESPKIGWKERWNRRERTWDWRFNLRRSYLFADHWANRHVMMEAGKIETESDEGGREQGRPTLKSSSGDWDGARRRGRRQAGASGSRSFAARTGTSERNSADAAVTREWSSATRTSGEIRGDHGIARREEPQAVRAWAREVAAGGRRSTGLRGSGEDQRSG